MKDRILLVEDDPAILRGLGDNLRAEAYDVLTASDGETAYRMLHDGHPDLVVLDVMLPRLSGTELCRRVRAEGITTPILMLTAFGDEDQRVRGLDAGADDYVTKPFLLNELLARVRGLLRHRRDWSAERAQLQREVRNAAEVQQQLLPRTKPATATLDCAGACLPALGVGGDYYDFIELAPGLIAFLIADVAGKGIPAALTMASLHGVIRTEASRFKTRCADLVDRVNTVLHGSVQPGRYATLFYAVYDDRRRTLTYVNAGHPPPMLVRGSRAAAAHEVVGLEASVPPLGLFPLIQSQQEVVNLRPGDWLLAFSDGITEALSVADEEFGRSRLLDTVISHVGSSADLMRDAILDAVSSHAQGRPQFDDVTLVVGRSQ